MSPLRRWAVVALPWIPLAIGFYFLFSENGIRAVRFGLYRPSTAQFFLDRDNRAGDDLQYDHQATRVVQFGISADFGLLCPKEDRENPNGFRVFSRGVWFLTNAASRKAAGDLVLGEVGDVPFCADFDGDGVPDNGVFHDGTWMVSTKGRGASADLTFTLGAPKDRPVVLNLEGAGNGSDRRNVAYGVYRQGTWYIDTKGDGTVHATHNFGGLPQDIPMLIPRWSADKDAAGKYSLVIFRDGIWHLKSDPDGPAILSFGFGQAGDIPLVRY
jgi:hypothetical protein